MSAAPFDYTSDVPEGVLDGHKKYDHPLVERYASSEMSYVFSPACKFSTWRKLWICLASAEKELGIKITDEQIKEMEENVFNIDFEKAAEYDNALRAKNACLALLCLALLGAAVYMALEFAGKRGGGSH